MPQTPPPGATLLTDLPEAEAWRVLREVALPIHGPRLRALREVSGVSLGLREKGGRVVSPRQPCLKVHLYRKGATVNSGWIDPWKTVTTAEHGRVAFRTDVLDLGGGRSEASFAPSPHVEATESGSACCLLADGERRFLLSAAHVLDGADPLLTVAWSKPGFRAGHGRFVELPETYWYPLRDEEADSWGLVDSGLVQIDEAGLYDNAIAVPWGSGLVPFEELPQLAYITLCGARTRRVGAEFASIRPTGSHVSVAGRDYKYWRVVLFRFSDQQRQTRGGDSGSPAIADDGRLVGMHLGVFRSEGVAYSMVLVLDDLLQLYRRVLSPNLELVTYDG
jgi:hypothetical protein